MAASPPSHPTAKPLTAPTGPSPPTTPGPKSTHRQHRATKPNDHHEATLSPTPPAEPPTTRWQSAEYGPGLRPRAALARPITKFPPTTEQSRATPSNGPGPQTQQSIWTGRPPPREWCVPRVLLRRSVFTCSREAADKGAAAISHLTNQPRSACSSQRSTTPEHPRVPTPLVGHSSDGTMHSAQVPMTASPTDRAACA